jgi:IS605 OrfB family transposase
MIGQQSGAASVRRARTRQSAAFQRAHGRLPADLCEPEAAPGGGHQVVLAAADKQPATPARCDQDPAHYAVLTVHLPVRPDPRTRADWHPVVIRFRLPPTIDVTAALHAPTLRLRAGRLRLDVAHTSAAPKTRRDGHVRAVAFDYGLNTLLTGGSLTLSDGVQPHVLTDARPVFRPDGVLAKVDRQRVLAEQIWAKSAHLQILIEGHVASGRRPHQLTAEKLAVLRTEHARVSRKRGQLNEQLAQAAAHFMVGHARAAKASVIYLEDLRDMEARGKGRALNTRLSQSVRGQIVAHTRHQAARYGIAVVIVPARGTSKYCPKCLTVFRHRTAPDRTTPGWKWASCPNQAYGYSADRDVAAWQRIGARGLHHQHLTVLDRSSGTYVIRRTIPELAQPVRHTTHPGPLTPAVSQQRSAAAHDRTKAGPTRNRPVPRQRRRVPAPPGVKAPGGKRPALRMPQSPTRRTQRRGRGAGTAHDEHPHPAPATWGSAGRGIPPARSRYSATVGNPVAAHYVWHGIALLIRDASTCTPTPPPSHDTGGRDHSRDHFSTGTGPKTQPHPGKPKLI